MSNAPTANVRKNARQITEYTVDVEDGVYIVQVTPTHGGGYRVTVETQYAASDLDSYSASQAAVQVALNEYNS